MDVDGIINRNPDGIFMGKNKSTPVGDLRDLALHDRFGFERKIWDVNGNRIPRLEFREYTGTERAGILVDLSSIDQLFRSAAVYSDGRDVKLADRVDKYPHAFIANSGSVQSRRPIPMFEPIINSINAEVAKDGLHAVYISSVQLYNRSIHFMFPRASEHPSPHGQVTARFLAPFARSRSEKTAAEKATRKLNDRLPYQNYNKKIRSPHVRPDLRIEQVFVIRANRMVGNEITPKYVYCWPLNNISP